MDPQLYLHTTAPDPQRVRPVENHGGWRPDQPRGGLWTSTYLGPQRGSAFVRSSLMPRGTAGAWLLEPEPGARVATIDCRADLDSLGARYGWVSQSGWLESTPDFASLARFFDAVHLTERGARACCSRGGRGLESWGLESTLWFRWAFVNVSYLGIDRYRRWPPDDPFALGPNILDMLGQDVVWPR